MKKKFRQRALGAGAYVGLGLALFVTVHAAGMIWNALGPTPTSATWWYFSSNHWGVVLAGLGLAALLYRQRMRRTMRDLGQDHVLMTPSAEILLERLVVVPAAARIAVVLVTCWVLATLMNVLPWLGQSQALAVLAGMDPHAMGVHQRIPMTLWEALNAYMLCRLAMALLLARDLGGRRRGLPAAVAGGALLWAAYSLVKALVPDGWPLLAADLVFGAKLVLLIRTLRPNAARMRRPRRITAVCPTSGP